MPVTQVFTRQREEDLKFKIIFGDIGSLRPAWDTVRPCLKTRKQNRVVLGAMTLSRTDFPICVL